MRKAVLTGLVLAALLFSTPDLARAGPLSGPCPCGGPHDQVVSVRSFASSQGGFTEALVHIPIQVRDELIIPVWDAYGNLIGTRTVVVPRTIWQWTWVRV